ncbi:phosphatidylserine decarboxylase-domain-containing protein [Pholiota molesta]|nr:phosphatidylserine decarboxylase-domain-containing protein [Pholiota molesta]
MQMKLKIQMEHFCLRKNEKIGDVPRFKAGAGGWFTNALLYGEWYLGLQTAEVAEANEAKLIALFTIFQSPFSLPDHPHPRRLPESRRGRTAGPAPLPALSDLPPPHTGLTNRAIWALAFCVCSSAAAGVSVVVVAAVANEVSPADGTVLHFGQLTDSRVEQVKGITYSLDTLLGIERPGSPTSVIKGGSNMSVVDDYEFPIVNGIDYTLEQLIGGTSSPSTSESQTPTSSASSSSAVILSSSAPTTPASNDVVPHKFGAQTDASVGSDNTEATLVHDASMALQMGVTSGKEVRLRPGNALFFWMIHLAPGDYHRYHSPTAWVVEKRRRFVGDLFSVSPWMAKRLNERIGGKGSGRESIPRRRYGTSAPIPPHSHGKARCRVVRTS